MKCTGVPDDAEWGPMTTDPRRALPAVDALLAHPTVAGAAAAFGRGRVTAAARHALDASRRAAAAGTPVPGLDELADQVADELRRRAGRRMRAVVNATGVVLHTNLGRAPLAEAAVEAVVAAAGYATVEYDLAPGAPRGPRGREAVVSRGELIEIGGEFRLPAVVEAAGVSLVEVGTTNRTHLADYAAALGERSACVLVVHPSNYRVEGFATRPPLAEVAALAHEHGLPLVHDAGSGLLEGSFGGEPSVAGALAAGADLVLFS